MSRLTARSRELLLLVFATGLLLLMLFGLETSQGRTLSTEMLYICLLYTSDAADE